VVLAGIEECLAKIKIMAGMFGGSDNTNRDASRPAGESCVAQGSARSIGK